MCGRPGAESLQRLYAGSSVSPAAHLAALTDVEHQPVHTPEAVSPGLRTLFPRLNDASLSFLHELLLYDTRLRYTVSYLGGIVFA